MRDGSEKDAQGIDLPRLGHSVDDDTVDDDTETEVLGETPIWRSGPSPSSPASDAEGPTNVLTSEQTAEMRAEALARARLEHGTTELNMQSETLDETRARYLEKLRARESRTPQGRPRRWIPLVILLVVTFVVVALLLLRAGGW